MNKKRIISGIVVALVVIAGLIILSIVLSYHKIKVSDPNSVSVSLYNSADKDKKTITTISSDTTLSLKDGEYCSVTSDSAYDTAPSCFTVQGKAISVTINPDYSASRLTALLPSELPAINTVITAKYAGIIKQYTVATGKLYAQGQWYGTTLAEIVAPSDRPDVYRVLLQKSNGEWKIIAYPQISLSKYDYPQVPYNILKDVNKQTGYSPDVFDSSDSKNSLSGGSGTPTSGQ